MRRTWGLLGAVAIAAAGCGGGSTGPVDNRAPRIGEFIVNPSTVVPGGSTRVTAVVVDPDGDEVTAHWTAAAGTFTTPDDISTGWTAPGASGTYTLVLDVTDGDLGDRDSVRVPVGAASLTVLSYPPGSTITLDGSFTPARTPHTFAAVAPGFHTVRAENGYYAFDPGSYEVEFADGDADTVRFAVRPAESLVLDLGRDDFLEIGGITFLPSGFGFLYGARTAEGTGLFTSSLNPPGAEPSGVKLVDGVDLDEPVTVAFDGSRVVYVDEEGLMISAAISDPNQNGIINTIDDFRVLEDGYGPTLSVDKNLAFTLSRSFSPPENVIFWGFFEDSTLSPLQLATTRSGRRPSWGPLGERIAFESDGVLFYNDLGFRSDTLAASPGAFLTGPAWGRWGEDHVALLRGADESSLTSVALAAPGEPRPVTVYEGLTDPRFLSWSPVQRSLVVSHNPAGRGEVVLLSGFPFP